jgi:hypothetical protein
MLRPETHADDAGWNPLQDRPAPQQLQRPWKGKRFGAAEYPPDDVVLDRPLEPLRPIMATTSHPHLPRTAPALVPAARINKAPRQQISVSDGHHFERITSCVCADGDYFRIWVADDRRPGVRIELEERIRHS